MPTNKPRITVTLDQEHYEVLSQMAKVTKSTMSSILASIVAESAPSFERVVRLMKEAEAAKASVGDRVREIATEAELDMLPMAAQAAKRLEQFESAIMRAIAQGGGKGVGGGK